MPRRQRMAWAALGAAFLGFELAVDLSIALVAQCLLFGGNDAATAWWCVRRDPIRSRGWLAAGLYATSALLKIGVGAPGVLMATGAIAGAVDGRDRSAIGPSQGEDPAFVMALVFAAVVSLAAAWGLANLTCVVALWRSRKLWLGPEAGLARRQGVWPPWAADESRLGRPVATNRVNLVVWLALIPWLTALILIATLGLGLLLEPIAAVVGQCVAIGVFIVGMLASMIGIPILALRRLDGRIMASSPFEAWELEAP